MRILFTIPHCVNPNGDPKYASSQAAQPRLQALTNSITALYHLFGQLQYASQYSYAQSKHLAVRANSPQLHDIKVVICTTGNYHCLEQLRIPNYLYIHHNLQLADPMMLEFECQAVLREHLGQYDYYCFLEDDLILHDPWFFTKLNWFTLQIGDTALLQPHRYELALENLIKNYIDSEIPYEGDLSFKRVAAQPELTGQIMEQLVKFHCPLNPHSGCYFLNAQQMQKWASQPYFLDRDCSYIGPLESAATLGILKTFQIYKPAPINANFLEIQHYDYKSQIHTEILTSELKRVYGSNKI